MIPALVALLALNSVNAVGPVSLGSDLSVLTHNDLYGNNSTRTGSVIVLDTWQSSAHAQQVCQGLGESLWTPKTADYLDYLPYLGKEGLYWASNGSCVNVSSPSLDVVSNCPAGSRPALCTNSAPIDNSTYYDNSTQYQVTVNSGNTSFTGYRDRRNFVFRGIKYAQPFERWTYSQVSNATGEISALRYGSQCVQAGQVGSEDCLFLNVWSPFLPVQGNETATQYLKPVMFWVHGGAFTGGTGADPTYQGGSLTSRGDVVVVTINYRLTTLGFLALEDGVTNGNYGLADQITALKWVHENIKAFGGDPNRITIFGQSAGAGSVRALLGSPPAEGLFAAVIMESNLAGLAYATTYSDYYTIAQEVKVAANPILNATNCTDVQCLRKVNPYLLANLTDVARYVVQDGTYIVTERLNVEGGGPAAKVPVMTGFMRDDGASFISYPKAGVNVSSLLNPAGFQGHLPDPIYPLYPQPAGTNMSQMVYNTSAAIATDTEFRCLDEATAYSAILNNVWPKAYVFTFNRTYGGYDPNPPVCSAPIEPGYPYGNPEAEYYKCHSGELTYVFGGLGYQGLHDRDGLDIPMSQFTLDFWTAFARTYDPNPSAAFLTARHFTNTSREIQLSGSTWDPISVSTSSTFHSLSLRVFQWPSYEAPFDIFSSAERCDAFGFTIDYYQKNSTAV